MGRPNSVANTKFAQSGKETSPATTLRYPAVPREHEFIQNLEHSSEQGCVIIGGGIIGLSTAYYLALGQGGFGANITVVDRAPELFLGASGKGNGVLGDYGFSPPTSPLGSLSWKLHNDLATCYDGRKRWGYSGILIHHPTRAADGKGKDSPVENHPLPAWFKYDGKLSDKLDCDPNSAGRLEPKQFCHFLFEECTKMKVEILLSSQVTQTDFEDGSLRAVDVVSECPQDVNSSFSRTQRTIRCANLVIAAGPWSRRVFESLYPSSPVEIPFDQDSKSGNYVQLRLPSSGGTVQKFCNQIYLNQLAGERVDLSDYTDGRVYVGGYLADTQELPDTVDEVQPQPEHVKRMMEIAQRFLTVSPGDEVSVAAEGRAYRPILSLGRPIITQVAFEDLAVGTAREEGLKNSVRSGVFLSIGHGSDGITLAPGSGLVMSELIRGVPPSADIDGLGLAHHSPGNGDSAAKSTSASLLRTSPLVL